MQPMAYHRQGPLLWNVLEQNLVYHRVRRWVAAGSGLVAEETLGRGARRVRGLAEGGRLVRQVQQGAREAQQLPLPLAEVAARLLNKTLGSAKASDDIVQTNCFKS